MALDPLCMDPSATPRRYQHLHASDSLPSLHLCPNRPLFVCARCGFSNALIPMCLWCTWSSAVAKKEFEEKLPRPRRMTAPSKRISADSTISSAGPVTPQGDLMFCVESLQVPGITAVLDSCDSELACSRKLGVARIVVDDIPNDKVDSQGDGGGILHDVTTATPILVNIACRLIPHRTRVVLLTLLFIYFAQPLCPSTAPTSTKQVLLDGPYKHETVKKQSIRYRRKLPALFLATSSSAHAHDTPHDLPRKSLMIQETTSRSNTSSVLIDAPHAAGGDVCPDSVSHVRALSLASVVSLSDSSQCCPKLRRKKGIPSLKRMSSLSCRSRSQQSSPAIDDRTESPAPYPVHVAPTPSPAPSTAISAEPPVRIGHPSRPYYTAIRKNMSRPSTAGHPSSLARTPSPIPSDYDYSPRATKSLDCGERIPVQFGRDSRPMSMVLPGQAVPVNLFSGFSLSGETEMRMNLARWRKEDGPDEPGDYLFKETGYRGKGIKGRVRKLGKGLRDLVLGRS
ncbi:hypothetical protein DFJ58DRAFT_801149 [Suillus subalutaceus]|uniref:uncharacterized protein n=1 Tax=Suillus subalutaceus TaxID=48586 RepID=UPI001B87B2D6|nr:uncharacterized protein DFJ58DRAFT_801149 [Suillus subalutaceus]KAG1845314.1 hypothetical protein DFJ58DRAFT_801149 [Suillus subalutaceus]